MSGAPFPWTFDQRFAADAAAPDGDPNEAVTREQGRAVGVTYASGQAVAVTRDAGKTDAEETE